jgi:crotonobetainyl-CoA:carnitine CoA-transferase CaiB-like acyl-CoA transferase
MLGEHTDEVLLEVGFEASEVEAFRQDGVVA